MFVLELQKFINHPYISIFNLLQIATKEWEHYYQKHDQTCKTKHAWDAKIQLCSRILLWNKGTSFNISLFLAQFIMVKRCGQDFKILPCSDFLISPAEIKLSCVFILLLQLLALIALLLVTLPIMKLCLEKEVLNNFLSIKPLIKSSLTSRRLMLVCGVASIFDCISCCKINDTYHMQVYFLWFLYLVFLCSFSVA